MRRKDREKDKDFALEVIDKAEYCVISMIDTDGRPYGVTVSHARIGDHIYFHCATEGKKTECLLGNHDVCVSFSVGVKAAKHEFTTAYSSAVVFGKAYQVNDDEEKITALRCICEKLTPDNMDDFSNAVERSLPRTAVWKIEIEEITGKQRVVEE